LIVAGLGGLFPATEAGNFVAVDQRAGCTFQMVKLETLLRVLVGQRVGAGDVHVVLEHDDIGWYMRLQQGVESRIRRNTWGTPDAGEQLQEDDAVTVAFAPGGFRLERDRIPGKLIVELR